MLVVKWVRIFDNAVSSGHKVGISRVLYECSMAFNIYIYIGCGSWKAKTGSSLWLSN